MKTRALNRPFEVKELGEDGAIVGYGSVFDVVDSYRDIVVRGAFLDSIQKMKAGGRKLKMLWQHRSDTPIGVWEEMAEDDRGLLLKGRLALSTYKGREVRELLKMGAVDGLSIGFSVPKGGEEYDQSRNVNLLKQVDLWETSIVTFPANEAAMVEEVRSDMLQHIRDTALKDAASLERYLKEDCGLPASVAKRLVAGWQPGELRDAGAEPSELRDAGGELNQAKSLQQMLRNFTKEYAS